MNPSRTLRLSIVSLFLFMPCRVEAALRLPALFCDHAVLQAERRVAFWGWAEPGAHIEVRFTNNQNAAVAKAETTVASDGRWLLYLPPQHSGDKGNVEVKTDRSESHTINDVVFGEVWLGSGQSNMGYKVGASNAPAEVLATAKAEAQEAGPEIRYFQVTSPGAAKPQDDVEGAWEIVTPDNVGACSAVAWNFAVSLRQQLHRPIGLVVSAVGGTPSRGVDSQDRAGQQRPSPPRSGSGTRMPFPNRRRRCCGNIRRI